MKQLLHTIEIKLVAGMLAAVLVGMAAGFAYSDFEERSRRSGREQVKLRGIRLIRWNRGNKAYQVTLKTA